MNGPDRDTRHGDAALRSEQDSLGVRRLAADSYFGIHTARASENFDIANRPISDHPELIVAFAAVKDAAARANSHLGLLDQARAAAIIRACREIRSGRFHDSFVVDILQGGAGTSTNMNANEVIANRALEHLGYPLGAYEHLHPIDHVNLSQSTNDVYPTAARLAAIAALEPLYRGLGELIDAFEAKGHELAAVVKMGRTQLQDAVPMTLGQEYRAYAHALRECRREIETQAVHLQCINLGGTAIGTGINAPAEFGALACARLSELVGVQLHVAENLIAASPDVGAFVRVSGALKSLALTLSKTCNDLRLSASGPYAGLREINLPALQTGSSIMPGKVNPVIPEAVNQAAYEVVGNDLAITMAAEAGQFQLNPFEPLIVDKLLTSIRVMARACTALGTRCVPGITANVEHLAHTVNSGIAVVTALSPLLGYAGATQLAHEAAASGRSVRELALATGHLEADELADLLNPLRLAGAQAVELTTAEQKERAR
ncbi:aspartate ammonia-lyase [Mycolicibacterium goodii]|uniref:Aspartate ammonia-lyase n=1 Tax=Mycolicibacterium goodii TaxID=134601 RepID=A0A0K0X218_MYCGD|nr:aspartate ammonia-lyase [Mycolicibacterium goodii]